MSASRLVETLDLGVRRALFPSFRADRQGGDAAVEDAAVEAARQHRERETTEALRREGRAAAYAEARAQLTAVAQALEAAAQQLCAHRRELAAELDAELPRVVLLLARKLVEREPSTLEAVATGLARTLAREVSGRGEPVVVRLDPASVQAFEGWLRASPSAPPRAAVTVEADPALAPGEWKIETRDGFLDGRFESQLEEAWRLLGEAGA